MQGHVLADRPWRTTRSRAKANGWLIISERQKLNSLQKRYKDLTMHTRVLQVYLQIGKYGV